MFVTRAVLTILGAVLCVTPALADTVIVTTPTGTFTNPGPTNAAGPGAGYDAWFANNVRGGGSAGISSVYADNGNGAIQFSSPAQGKADFEYYFSTGFALSDLSALSYDIYRASSSTAAAKYSPALRLYVSDGTHTGYLVYEGIYNGQNTAPLNAFQTENVINDFFWSTGTLPDAFNVYNRTLTDWDALLPNLKVYGLSTGIGSGWDGTFDGAVDNITYGVNGKSTTYNFEVAGGSPVPEPSSITLLGSGLLALGAFVRREGRSFKQSAR